MAAKKSAKETKKSSAKKAGKQAKKEHAEKKKPAEKKAKADIWAPEEKVVPSPALVKADGKQAEKKTEVKQAHLATAQELLKSGVDTSIIFYPLVTEKAVNMIESQNKLCFIVAEAADKPKVKKAVETMFGIKVDAVNIVRDMKGRKKAIVKINKAFKADEVAMKLGVI